MKHLPRILWISVIALVTATLCHWLFREEYVSYSSIPEKRVGESVLSKAARNGDLKTTKDLIASEAHFLLDKDSRRVAFQAALDCDNPEIVQLFIKHSISDGYRGSLSNISGQSWWYLGSNGKIYQILHHAGTI